MFGTKLRTWMEAHIVRSKKKKERKKSEKGFDSNCNSPRSHGTNRSPALYQVHPVDSATKNVDTIRLHGEEGGRCTSTGSAPSAGNGSVNLSSPESAYSTGYSTDGTSPGTSYPPEYYINIRTGTHYFQSNANIAANTVAITPTSNMATTATGNHNYRHNDNNNSRTCNNNNNNNNNGSGSKRSIDTTGSVALSREQRRAKFDGNVELTASTSNAIFGSGNANMDRELTNETRASTPSKIGNCLASDNGTTSQNVRAHAAHRQEGCQQQQYQQQRTESFTADSPPPFSVPSSMLSPMTQSPRERSRIRTNPWLSAGSCGSSTTGVKCKQSFEEARSGSGFRLTESSGSASDVNASSVREVRTRREFKQESLSAGRSPINQNWRIASGMEIRPKITASVQWRNGGSSSSSGGSNSSRNSSATDRSASSGSCCNDDDANENENENENDDDSSATSLTRSVRSSEDDITLNEMMGKFDESYVYEKETDILSDSDPTDCDDYIESLSDVDGVHDTGDENKSLDNAEMDFIDNGSFLELDHLDRFKNTGHCTYFAFTGELARRSSKLRDSLMRRRTKEDSAMFHRTISGKSVSRKQVTRHRKPMDVTLPNEKRKKKGSQRRKSNLQDGAVVAGGCVAQDDEETANLNRVLVERMLLKNSGFNQGSRSVGGTPICLRRRKHDVNKNLSPMKSRDEQALIDQRGVNSPEIVDKRRSNSVSYVNGNLAAARLSNRISGSSNAYLTTFASEIALMEADKEADKKYQELIVEAESILLNMQKSQSATPMVVPSPCRKLHYGPANKRVELIKNTELNIEHALTKSRNSQPELQSGSIKDLEHASPKRQFSAQPGSPFRRLSERNAPGLVQLKTFNSASPDSSSMTRRPAFNCDGALNVVRSHAPFSANAFPFKDSLLRNASQVEFRDSMMSTGSRAKEEGIMSSSSDSEERADIRRRPPLMAFRSIDMGPIKEGSYYCPQSEPVKRKVYAGSATYDRIQKTLGEHVTLRNSDGDTATDPDTDDSRRSLKEKVAKLRHERLASSSNGTVQDPQLFQHQLSHLRRQMLMQTIQGLKRSLEDQSATLKQTCLEPVIADRLP